MANRSSAALVVQIAAGVVIGLSLFFGATCIGCYVLLPSSSIPNARKIAEDSIKALKTEQEARKSRGEEPLNDQQQLDFMKREEDRLLNEAIGKK